MPFELLKYLRSEEEVKDESLNRKLLDEVNKAKKKLNTPEHITLHKHDLEIDMSVLLDEEHECNDFVWIVRDCGTHIYPKEHLYSKSSYAFTEFKYFENRDRFIYEVTVTKRDQVNKKVYGNIKKVKTDEFTENVLSKSSKHNHTLCKVITTEGDKLIEKLNIEDGFGAGLRDSKIFKENLKKNYDNIKKVYYLKYL